MSDYDALASKIDNLPNHCIDDTSTIAKLAELDPFEYDRVRDTEAERLGCRVSTLDGAVKAARSRVEETGGHAVDLYEPEPWPTPVDGAELLSSLAELVCQHIILEPAAADAAALWVVHAHAHASAAISPILAITSPSPECGKTTLLTLLGELVPRPLPASNITAAALFRAVEEWQPCLLIDEADTFLRKSDELRGIINSGHSRAAAYVIRTAGDDHEPRRFRTWAPKVIAAIGNLSPTLASRAITIELRRMAPVESVDPLRGDRLGHLAPYARKVARWVGDHIDAIGRVDPEMPETVRGRGADNWRHLVAIADLAGGEWPVRVREAAQVLSGSASEQTAGIMLLADLRRMFGERNVDVLSSAEVADALGAMEDRPWPEWGRAQKPITQRQVARLLEPFKVRPSKFRADGYTPGTRGYELEYLHDAFNRYLPAVPSATAPQRRRGAGFGAFQSATVVAGVADEEMRKRGDGAACGVVADQEAAQGCEAVDRAAVPSDAAASGTDNRAATRTIEL